MLCCECGNWVEAEIGDIVLDGLKYTAPIWHCPVCQHKELVLEIDKYIWASTFPLKSSGITGFTCCPEECPSCRKGPMEPSTDFFLNYLVFPFHGEDHPGWLCPHCGYMDRVSSVNIEKWVEKYRGWGIEK